MQSGLLLKVNQVYILEHLLRYITRKISRKVYKIYEIVEFEKWCISIAKNLHNLDTHHIVKISPILSNAYIIPRDQIKIIFHVNNHID